MKSDSFFPKYTDCCCWSIITHWIYFQDVILKIINFFRNVTIFHFYIKNHAQFRKILLNSNVHCTLIFIHKLKIPAEEIIYKHGHACLFSCFFSFCIPRRLKYFHVSHLPPIFFFKFQKIRNFHSTQQQNKKKSSFVIKRRKWFKSSKSLFHWTTEGNEIF